MNLTPSGRAAVVDELLIKLVDALYVHQYFLRKHDVTSLNSQHSDYKTMLNLAATTKIIRMPRNASVLQHTCESG